VKEIFIFLVATLPLGMLGCTTKGIPVEFARLCDEGNYDENVEVSGYFTDTVTAENCGGESRICSVKFVGDLAGTNVLMAHIGLGGGKSAVELTTGDGREIRDETGAVVEKNQKVKIVARVVRLNEGYKERCYVTVKKIEKAGP
jgi:hypothetical protein